MNHPGNHTPRFLGLHFTDARGNPYGMGLRATARAKSPVRTSASRKALTNNGRRLRYHPTRKG